IFQEYLTNQGTAVKTYFWQGENCTCAKCPYHIRTGEEARVPYAEFHRAFGFPYTPTATLPNNHLLFYELRSFSGRVVQKGHATNCTDLDNHPESMLFEVGSYLDAVTSAYETSGHITLYSNYSPCNEAYHRCVSNIYAFLLKHPEITLCIYFSWLYHTEDSFPAAAWNREALQSLSSLWPRVTLQRLPEELWHYLLCNFVYGIPGATLYHPTPQLRNVAGRLNPHTANNVAGMEALPGAAQGKPAVQRSPAFLSPSPASQQPLPALKGSLPPPMSQSHPGMLLTFQKHRLYPRPKNIVRHLKIPRE
ncbi:ABEC1 enzyme, partial [Zapornia atra]|nr:ABEC1 enzyme [Zapornia atra]